MLCYVLINSFVLHALLIKDIMFSSEADSRNDHKEIKNVIMADGTEAVKTVAWLVPSKNMFTTQNLVVGNTNSTQWRSSM